MKKLIQKFSCVVAIGLAGIVGAVPLFSEDGSRPTGSIRKLANLANDDIRESSGLAASRRHPGHFWTHNDSGDSPRIFRFDREGQDLGAYRLRGAEAIDWEDMASFEHNGEPWLLVGDVGDNGSKRNDCVLYLCREPTDGERDVASRSLRYRYVDGPHNCESVGVDVKSKVILLVTKVQGTSCQVFELPLVLDPTDESLVAKPIATIAVPTAVAMDIAPDGHQTVVLTYTEALRFSRGEGETWSQAFSRPGIKISMPLRRQGESICFGGDGRALYLTSEFAPSPLYEVDLATRP